MDNGRLVNRILIYIALMLLFAPLLFSLEGYNVYAICPGMQSKTRENQVTGAVVNNLYVKAKATGYFYYGADQFSIVYGKAKRGVDYYGPWTGFTSPLYGWFKTYDKNNHLLDYEYDFTDSDEILYSYRNSNPSICDGNIDKIVVRAKTKVAQYIPFTGVIIYEEWIEAYVVLRK